ncbi:radical SAM protein [Candidatus Parcubacteria bacterium]|nr:radical SAM protein [Candidatus Parcubacteria bacterium]
MTASFKEWHWEITKRCNLFCRYCLTNCGPSAHESLATSDALMAIKTMAELGCEKLMITGGEPFVRKDLFKLLEYSRKKNFSLGLLTNGFLVKEKIARRLADYIDDIGVSIDGLSSQTHNFARGEKSFQRASRFIAILSAYLPVSAYVTISAVNIHELPKIAKFIFELGASRIHFSEISMSGRAKDNLKHFKLTVKQKKLLKQFAVEMTMGIDGVIDNQCNADLSVVYLSAEGIVYPCSEVAIHAPSQSLADIKHSGCKKELEAKKQSNKIPLNFSCCYEVHISKRMVFYLNTRSQCALIKKERGWL